MNECEAKTHNCSVNATCINTKGSFNCTCVLGYDGDGHNCTGECFVQCFPANKLFFRDRPPIFFTSFIKMKAKQYFHSFLLEKYGLFSSVMTK